MITYYKYNDQYQTIIYRWYDDNYMRRHDAMNENLIDIDSNDNGIL